MKSRINESKNARSKVQYKSADDVQKQIDTLQKEVDSGKMKIVDEKKTLSEISQLNRIKKSFATFDDNQKGIDDLRAQIAELKNQRDDPESKALSEKYDKVKEQLAALKSEQDDAFQNINALRDERTKIHEDQQKKYATVKEIKDAYYSQRRAAMDYEREARRVREEKRKAENDAYHRGRRQEAAKAKLEDASAPAYGEQIRVAQSLLAHFDPSSVSKQEAAGPGKFAATASRTVDGSGIKGTALKKKGEDDDAYFVGGGGKKKKGGKKGQSNEASSPAPEGKFQLDPRTIEYLADMNIDPPLSQADVPNVVEKIKEKLEFWKKDQDRKTKEVSILEPIACASSLTRTQNVANAEAEIKRLEDEAAAIAAGGSTDAARKPAEKNQQVNGSASAGAELSQEKDASADVTKDLEKAKIEDKAAPGGTA